MSDNISEFALFYAKLCKLSSIYIFSIMAAIPKVTLFSLLTILMLLLMLMWSSSLNLQTFDLLFAIILRTFQQSSILFFYLKFIFFIFIYEFNYPHLTNLSAYFVLIDLPKVACHGQQIEMCMVFCREILVSTLFHIKKSSTERGKVWGSIADKLCPLRAPIFRVDQRAV